MDKLRELYHANFQPDGCIDLIHEPKPTPTVTANTNNIYTVQVT